MRAISLALLVCSVSIWAAAQGNPQRQPDTTPAPAFGQNAPILGPENPPLSSLDEPSLELPTASRSFISPALQVSESVQTNGRNQIGGSGVESVSRVLGAFDLQQFWSKSDFFLEYLGGGAFYSSPYQAKQLQAAGMEAVTRWRTGRATLRDTFSYLPDGTFSIGTFGGAPGLGFATGGLGTGQAGGGLPGFSAGHLGSIGNIPRLANTALLDVVQALNPVSAITVAGGFSNAHFFDNSNTPDPLVNSDQITFQGGYSRLFSRHDQIGAIYGFQLFQFPQATGGQIYNHVANLRWSHTISGRLSLIAGAGPQYTDFQTGGGSSHWSLSGRVQLHYKFAHSSLVATWVKFTSEGSGLFPGADTQAVRFGYKRQLGRTWEVLNDVGYAHNKKLQSLGNLGANGSTYNEVSVSSIFRKHIGRTYDFFAAYRFSELSFDVAQTGLCEGGGPCGKTDLRHAGTVGIEWHPTPTRIE